MMRMRLLSVIEGGLVRSDVIGRKLRHQVGPVALNNAAQLGVDLVHCIEALDLDPKRFQLVGIEHMTLVNFDGHSSLTPPTVPDPAKDGAAAPDGQKPIRGHAYR